jgi:hypothetical protein
VGSILVSSAAAPKPCSVEEVEPATWRDVAHANDLRTGAGDYNRWVGFPHFVTLLRVMEMAGGGLEASRRGPPRGHSRRHGVVAHAASARAGFAVPLASGRPVPLASRVAAVNV